MRPAAHDARGTPARRGKIARAPVVHQLTMPWDVARFAAFALLPPLAIGCGSASIDASSARPDDAGASAWLDASADADDSRGPRDATLPALPDGAPSGPCDEDMALVTLDGGAVCVDLYEGAMVQRMADGGEAPWPWYLPVDDVDASDLRAVPAHGAYPQGYVSNVQAQAACRASGKRLCTLDEWTAACRGRPAHDYVYPYGDTYEAGRCNEGDESPIVRIFGPSPTYSNDELNDPRCDQLDGGLERGGTHASCASAYGAFDMHGNLHEWIDDTPVPSEPDRGSFVGGYFVDAKLNGAGCEYRTTAHAKTYHDYSTGFRCCAAPR
jgi:hypothetical protein